MEPIMDHRVPDVSSEYHKKRWELARISDEYGGLPRLFAIRADNACPPRTGSVAAWGVEFPDGTAITYKPGGAFGTWESPVSAAVLLGDGSGPLYLAFADA
jgi:hypothetical protein